MLLATTRKRFRVLTVFPEWTSPARKGKVNDQNAHNVYQSAKKNEAATLIGPTIWLLK